MTARFSHHFEILPKAQKKIWPELASFKDSFVLYGGTALALRIGHRQSVDFDFFTEDDLDHTGIAAALPNIEGTSILQSEMNTYTLMFPLEDAFVKLSFFGGIDFGRVGTPELTNDGTLLVASLQDLLATKLKVIMQRVEPKDYFDVTAILSRGISLEKGLASTLALFGKAFSPSDCLRALAYFEDPHLTKLNDGVKKILWHEVSRVLSLDSLPKVERTALSLR